MSSRPERPEPKRPSRIPGRPGSSRLALVLAALIGLVTIGLIWAGATIVEGERDRVRSRIEQAYVERLEDRVAELDVFLSELERRLLGELESAGREPAKLLRRTPELQAVFLLSADGQVMQPRTDDGPAAIEFLMRTSALFEDRRLIHEAAAESSKGGGLSHGWTPYYHAEGLRLLLWQRAEDGWISGGELSRSRLLADLIARLPSSPRQPGSAAWRLIGADGRAVYAWGRPGEEDDVVVATRPLIPPLEGWRLEVAVALPELESSFGSALGLVVGSALAALILSIIGLALWWYRDTRRQWSLAARRVSFVNRAAHELKTPLTNIRLYAEMLEGNLEEGDPGRADVDVIVEESRRLSRLVETLLAYARGRRGTLEIHPRPAEPDRCLGRLVEGFGKRADLAGVEIEVELAAPGSARVDVAALECIVANLVVNALSYAASGGLIRLESRRQDSMLIVELSDRGPGVPRADRERVFEPFERLSQRLDEGSSGTGIGLATARELARLHGGELRLVDSKIGAKFSLELDAPLEKP